MNLTIREKRSNPVAMITGVGGQDGSYLAELLLRKGYTVVGICRRSSVDNTERVSHLKHLPHFKLIEGDVTDACNVNSWFTKYKPDEFYNLAGQTHVGTSFEQPLLTFRVNAEGVLNILESARCHSPKTRLYQASTSEMFGNNFTTCGIKEWQDEDTPFSPQSPYAVAKVAAHDAFGLYRRAYGLHASAGILFNHETLTYSTPLICRNSQGLIDIAPIGDIARLHSGVSNFDIRKEQYQEGIPQNDLWVWDKNGWTKVTYVSGYPHTQFNNTKMPRIINSRRSVYAATGSHVCIMDDDSEVATSNLEVGDTVKLCEFPEIKVGTDVDIKMAEWLGMMVGDGNLHGKTPRFTNKDMKVKQRFVDLWKSFVTNGTYKFIDSKSGFTGEPVGQVECYAETIPVEILDVYTEGDISPFGHINKKVPICILNSSIDAMEAFLIGYNVCDGLKANPCKYKFKNFKTNSHSLAAGLIYVIHKVTGQKYNITVEESWKYGKQQFYYSINLLSDNPSPIEKFNIIKPLLEDQLSQREISKKTGISRGFIRKVNNGYVPSNTHHLEKPTNEIKKIIDIPNYDGWFFDLETESGTFQAGAGQGVVHNSERRGDQFVTRKITKWIGEFEAWMNRHGNGACYNEDDYLIASDSKGILVPSSCGTFEDAKFPKLRLGNLDTFRDWGHAEDYVEAMWRMLQQDGPDDYVISTGKTHSIEEFLTEAFSHTTLIGSVGSRTSLWKYYVVQDPEFMRPAEVDFLCGNANKAKSVLGWEPKVTFEELVSRMVQNDIEIAHNKSKALLC